MAVDDVARRAMKNHASRLREALVRMETLEKSMRELTGRYEALRAEMMARTLPTPFSPDRV